MKYRFKYTQQQRFGKGLKLLFDRWEHLGHPRDEMHRQCKRSAEYIQLLEAGHEPDIDEETLENFVNNLIPRNRGKLSPEAMVELVCTVAEAQPSDDQLQLI